MNAIPGAARQADEIVKEADVLCVGRNALAQITFGFAREEAGKFSEAYY